MGNRIETGYSREWDQADTEKDRDAWGGRKSCSFCPSLSSSSFSLFQFFFFPHLVSLIAFLSVHR